jgi:hypothetical protein
VTATANGDGLHREDAENVNNIPWITDTASTGRKAEHDNVIVWFTDMVVWRGDARIAPLSGGTHL